MARPRKDPKRKERIRMEIAVDAHDPQEQALGWYYYLQDNLRFPFAATCAAERPTSPLLKGDEVEVVGMPQEDECAHEMFVNIRHERKRVLAVPLSQLKVVSDATEETKEAVADWHYWVNQGYEL